MSVRQAEELERLRKLEALRLADRGAWAGMTPDQRAAFAEAQASTPEGKEPPSAAVWLTQHRLAAQGAAPWTEEVELRRRANRPDTQVAVSDWVGRQAAELARMERELEQLPMIQANATRAASLESAIKAQRGAVEQLQRLGPYERYVTYCRVVEAGADSSEADMSDAIDQRKEQTHE